MFFQHIYDKSLAQASYIIGCQKAKVAAVIDPKRDIDTYLEIAKQNNMQITHVLETHIHADFLCGSRELAELTGADLYLSDEGGQEWQYEFPHIGLKHDSVINLGNLRIDVLHTPGHTPESISFLLTDLAASKEPVMIFTGDFVFVGDVGRPDLLEKAAGIKGSQDKGAKQMFESLKLFEKLPDFLQVWPGHGAGSACGKSLGAVPSTTVGYEKLTNWALRLTANEAEFTKSLLTDQPEPPKYFALMKKLNHVPRPLLTSVPKLKKLNAEEFYSAYEKGMVLADTRNKNTFFEGFIPGSINIQANNSFGTWAGSLLNYDEPFMLLADESQIEELTRKLMRVGLDNIHGYITSTAVWEGDLNRAQLIKLPELKHLHRKKDVQIVDVRAASEYKNGHIEGADHVFVGTLPDNLDKVSKDKQVIIHCQAGDRAAIAYSLLLRYGYKNVLNYSGGMNEWIKENNPVTRGSEKEEHR